MMKTFDEIYQELKTEDMQEINKLYECVKKKSKNQKRIALIICAIVDILILFLVSANLKSVFFSMFAIMFIFIIDTVIYVIITLISGFSKEYKELTSQRENKIDDMGLTKEYFGTRGDAADNRYKDSTSVGQYESEEEWKKKMLK